MCLVINRQWRNIMDGQKAKTKTTPKNFSLIYRIINAWDCLKYYFIAKESLSFSTKSKGHQSQKESHKEAS